MPPKKMMSLPAKSKGLAERPVNSDQTTEQIVTRAKRKAPASPLKYQKIKRSALGNLTNNLINVNSEEDKKSVAAKQQVQKENCQTTASDEIATTSTQMARAKSIPEDEKMDVTILPKEATTKCVSSYMMTRAAAAKLTQPVSTIVKSKDLVPVPPKPATRRISNAFEQTEDSLYESALEDIPTTSGTVRWSAEFQQRQKSPKPTTDETSSEEDADKRPHIPVQLSTPSPVNRPRICPPDGVHDFDLASWNDCCQVSNYAFDIFNYMKSREDQFKIIDYIPMQPHLSKWMRALLVDWMVEVQETFELNHETLYLGVKIVDIFLGKAVIDKDKLQLLGAAALFISCKFDERVPPLIENFLYICDGAYTKRELTRMEIHVLKTIGYELGIPLSYRFLRRYARCAKISMPTLTLARYILEFTLMDYDTITFSDSKIACAALFIALQMKRSPNLANSWSKTLQFYTGYSLQDFAYMVPIMNGGLLRKPRDNIRTIKNKYSHRIFFEVAKMRVFETETLFIGTRLSVPRSRSHHP